MAEMTSGDSEPMAAVAAEPHGNRLSASRRDMVRRCSSQSALTDAMSDTENPAAGAEGQLTVLIQQPSQTSTCAEQDLISEVSVPSPIPKTATCRNPLRLPAGGWLRGGRNGTSKSPRPTSAEDDPWSPMGNGMARRASAGDRPKQRPTMGRSPQPGSLSPHPFSPASPEPCRPGRPRLRSADAGGRGGDDFGRRGSEPLRRCTSASGTKENRMVRRSVEEALDPWSTQLLPFELKQAVVELKELNTCGHWKCSSHIEEIASIIFDFIDTDGSGYLNHSKVAKFLNLVVPACPVFSIDPWQKCAETKSLRLRRFELYAYFHRSFKAAGKKQFIAQMFMVAERMRSQADAEPTGEFVDLRTGTGCVVDACEHRGILRRQLHDILKYVKRHCVQKGWTDTSETSPTRGMKLTHCNINLYQLVEWVVKPATQARQCSYVEFVANAAQIPKWFASHWWGEAVHNFVMCLDQHAKDRCLSNNDAYWVCAYANNQWDLDADVEKDPKQSSFRRALNLVDGTISIVDPNAKCFTRIWCCYEVWVSTTELRNKRQAFRYDMYTVSGGKAVGIVDGCAERDASAEYKLDAKFLRERSFPLELCKRAFAQKLEEAEASEPVDKRRILNSIAHRQNLDAIPPTEHSAYKQLNKNFYARIAVSCLRIALERGEDLDIFRENLDGHNLPQWELSFDNCPGLRDAHVADLSRGISSEMRSVHLDFSFCNSLTSQALSALGDGIAKGKGLQRICLCFIKCAHIEDDGVVRLGEALKSLKHLTDVDFNFYGNQKITNRGAKALFKNLPQQKMTHISLDFSFNPNITKDAIHELDRGQHKKLEELNLKLHSCHAALTNASIASIVAAASRSSQLRCLSLDLRFGSGIKDEGLLTLARAFANKLRALQELSLDLAECEAVCDLIVAELVQDLPPQLQVLDLGLCKTPVTDVGVRTLSGSLPQSLEKLRLNFSEVSNLTAEPFRLLATSLPPRLTSLQLQLYHCECVEKVKEIFDEEVTSAKGISIMGSAQQQPRIPGTTTRPSSADDASLASGGTT